MDYEALTARLFERHRSVQTAGFSGEAYKPGLESMQSYSDFLGRPERRFRSIHVAGTNGKGSVCSMLAAALAADGSRVGLYTSPHLLDFRERIKIVSGASYEMIPKEAVCDFVDRYDRDGLSFFEVTTGLAFWWFAERKVDVAVIETGLGGRLDSTNIITPELSVVTSIGLDHCELLGNSRAEIAAEKAGIFKPGVPALVWGRDPETSAVFESAAAAKGSPLYFAEDFAVEESLARPAGLDLSGPCQDINFRTVCAALSVLDPSGLNGEQLQAIASAGRITGLRGRWELLRTAPAVICDIGHNPQALQAGFSRLAAEGADGRGPLLVVYGAMRDKDVDTIAGILPEDAVYFLVQPATPRAMPADDLALKLKKLDCTVSGTVADGIRDALERAGAESIVFIGGSTYVVSEALQYFEGL